MVFTSVFDTTDPSDSSIPAVEFRDSVSLYLWQRLDLFGEHTLFVDYDTRREWTGEQIKILCARTAKYLIRNGLLDACGAANSVFLTLYPNGDYVNLMCLATLFAGCTSCSLEPLDPKDELEYSVGVLKPKLVCASKNLIETLRWLMDRIGSKFNVCIMDDASDADLERCKQVLCKSGDDNDIKIIGFNKHLLTLAQVDDSNSLGEDAANQLKLPCVGKPDDAAFLLLTSGSTGRSKPVIRSQRNALYDCHLFKGECGRRLWHLDSSSVMAGHLPLDHGTGTFNVLMAAAEGVKVVLMRFYQFEELCDAIARYKITDCMLGSALLHNFIESKRWDDAGKLDTLSSLRNFIAIGSPIVSLQAAARFMQKHGKVSIRQAYGMTECGFVSVVEPNRSFETPETSSVDEDAKKSLPPVGLLLPNIRVKLLEQANEQNGSAADDRKSIFSRAEVTETDKVGELFLSGPTVAPGYWGAAFEEQSEEKFIRCTLSAGCEELYYRSSDLAMINGATNELVVLGRMTDVLCLFDGWKVLPQEIELVLMMHPNVLEASVVGVPHPDLPGQHAPRAYVVTKRSWQTVDDEVKEHELKEFVAERVASPKKLDGGIKFLQELPRISIGKVDKRALLQADGY